MATFSAQVTDLIGGTLDQTACDQWAVDGAREIIVQLPASVQEKCSDKSTLNASTTTLDLDTATIGKILYCTRNNGSYDIPCRLVSAVDAHLVDDSTATNYYAVADDPAYFIRDNKVEIKPNPTGAQNGFVYHLLYPSSIDISADSSIASFPIEAEHLLVLHIAMKQILQYQSTMATSWNSNITTALSNASDVINNNQPSSTTDAYGALNNEDIEIMSAALQLASSQLADAGSRLQQDSAKYQWYTDQYAKLAGDYTRAFAALKGT